jgi:aarF domain-containing kinase
VLRTIQLLRGLTVGMGLSFSCAQQWRPIAEEALLKAGRLRGKSVLICILVISLLILF